MGRTQDLVLARLRLVSRRWASGDGKPGEGSAGPAPPRAAPWRAWVALGAVLVVLVAGLALARTSRALSGGPSAGSVPGPGVVDLPSVSPPVARAGPAPAPAAAGPALADAPDSAESAAEQPLAVHVAGDVRRPGLVLVPPGSRVVDAVAAAGGLRRGGSLGPTNLARLVVDGERIEVGGAMGASSPGSAIDGPTVGPLDLNTATVDQLDELPGIGPVTAAKILAWRSANGRFTVVDELAEISGIGSRTLAELRPLVRV